MFVLTWSVFISSPIIISFASFENRIHVLFYHKEVHFWVQSQNSLTSDLNISNFSLPYLSILPTLPYQFSLPYSINLPTLPYQFSLPYLSILPTLPYQFSLPYPINSPYPTYQFSLSYPINSPYPTLSILPTLPYQFSLPYLSILPILPYQFSLPYPINYMFKMIFRVKTFFLCIKLLKNFNILEESQRFFWPKSQPHFLIKVFLIKKNFISVK